MSKTSKTTFSVGITKYQFCSLQTDPVTCIIILLQKRNPRANTTEGSTYNQEFIPNLDTVKIKEGIANGQRSYLSSVYALEHCWAPARSGCSDVQEMPVL